MSLAARAALGGLVLVSGLAGCRPAPAAVAGVAAPIAAPAQAPAVPAWPAARHVAAPTAPIEAFDVAAAPAAAGPIAIAPGRIVDADAPETILVGPAPAPSPSPSAR